MCVLCCAVFLLFGTVDRREFCCCRWFCCFNYKYYIHCQIKPNRTEPNHYVKLNYSLAFPPFTSIPVCFGYYRCVCVPNGPSNSVVMIRFICMNIPWYKGVLFTSNHNSMLDWHWQFVFAGYCCLLLSMAVVVDDFI